MMLNFESFDELKWKIETNLIKWREKWKKKHFEKDSWQKKINVRNNKILFLRQNHVYIETKKPVERTW